MSLVKFIADPKFEDYKETFKDNYKLERREDGVILVQAHTNGGPIQLSVENHRSVAQVFKTVGADPENEVMIFTGTGDNFMMEPDPDGFKIEAENLNYWAYEYAFKPLTATMFSLLAFYVASAAFRAFRAKNVEAVLLLTTAFIVLLGRTFAGVWLTSWMPPEWSEFTIPGISINIMQILNTAGNRAIMIGIALGVVSLSLRIILGIDRSYLGSKEG